MTVRTLTATFLAVNLALLLPPVTLAQPQAAAPAGDDRWPQCPPYQRFLSPASPLELVAAKTVDRVAWTAFEEGKRNAYTAAAPAFTPVRLTNFMTDNGIDLSGIRISDDGSTVVFVRARRRTATAGSPIRRRIPTARARDLGRAHRRRPGLARRARCGEPGARARRQRVLFVKDGQIYRAQRDADAARERAGSRREAVHQPVGRAERPKWSPDGRKIAFVSTRTDHSFIMVYDVATRTVKYMSPSVDFDTSPLWTADSKSVVFVRRPGSRRSGSRRSRAAAASAFRTVRRFRPDAGTRSRRSRSRATPARRTMPAAGGGASRLAPVAQHPGPVAGDVQGRLHPVGVEGRRRDRRSERGLAQPAERSPVHELREPASGGRPPDRSRSTSAAVARRRARRAGAGAPAAGPVDEWERYYSINLATPNAQPVLLTTTDGLIEDETSVALSADGKTLYYCTNADGHRAPAHLGGAGRRRARRAGHDRRRDRDVSGAARVGQDARDAQRRLADAAVARHLAARRPTAAARRRSSSRPRSATSRRDAHVEPRARPDEGARRPRDPQPALPAEGHQARRAPPGDRLRARRAGAPDAARLPLHAVLPLGLRHQSVARDQGYVVLSVNYRSGIGYGRSFRTGAEHRRHAATPSIRTCSPAGSTCSRGRTSIPTASASGASRTAACSRRRRSRATPTSSRPASTWPACTSGAARSIPTSVSFKSSAIGAIDGWKSPVLLVHGDDDRNVAFQQTTGLVQLLRAARRLLRADRLSGRHARVDAAQPVAVHARADGAVLQEVPGRGAEADDVVRSPIASPAAPSACAAGSRTDRRRPTPASRSPRR